MRIVYLHGWGEKFDESKYKILSKFGDEVYFPENDYQSSGNLINIYTSDIYNNPNPTLIVGNSLGGYFGFYISNIINSPALLFNPSFYFKSGGELRPNIGATDYREKKIVLSLKDEDIDIKRTIKFLKEFNYNDDKIKTYEDLGHQIPLDVFENEFSEFREKYKEYKGCIDQNKKKTRRESKSSNSRWEVERADDGYQRYVIGNVQDIAEPNDTL